eukprot:10385-Heterococcus_DN1.PRE.3
MASKFNSSLEQKPHLTSATAIYRLISNYCASGAALATTQSGSVLTVQSCIPPAKTLSCSSDAAGQHLVGAQWDAHMRHIVLSFSAVQEQRLLFEALSAAECTNLVKAKALVESSSTLQSVPEELQSRFREAVGNSTLSEGPRFNVNELPPRIERSLYLVLMGTGIRAADPDEHLHRALCMNGMHRLHRAKAQTVESPCFQTVPAAARDRFLHLLQAVPDTADAAWQLGTHREFDKYTPHPITALWHRLTQLFKTT